jgi:hypothetical protein
MLALSDAFDSAMQNYVIPKTPVFGSLNFHLKNLANCLGNRLETRPGIKISKLASIMKR